MTPEDLQQLDNYAKQQDQIL
jgi:hypothetical protein